MTRPNLTSRWVTQDLEEFRIIAVNEVEGQTWVHYRRVATGEEYSCWLESFLHRFTEIINQ
jgi:hypothetical protein